MAILLAYNFTANNDPSTVAAGLTGSTILGNNLTSFTNGGAGYASDPVIASAPITGATSAALAVTNSSYWYVSITPSAGNSISLTSLTFDIARGGASTPRGYDVRSNKTGTGYDTSIGTANTTAQRTTFQNISINLTGSEYQNVTDTITFRVYVYSPSTVNTVDFDNVVINGSTAASGTVEQEGFLFRNDDGSESTATSLAAQDVNVTQPKVTNTRLRVLLNGTLDRGAELYRLEYRKVGDPSWEVM